MSSLSSEVLSSLLLTAMLESDLELEKDMEKSPLECQSENRFELSAASIQLDHH